MARRKPSRRTRREAKPTPPANLATQLPPPTQTGPGDAAASVPATVVPEEAAHLWSARTAWNWLKVAVDNFLTIDGTTWSASFAYYAFFALFPMLLVFVTIGTDVAARFTSGPGVKQQAYAWTVNKVEAYMPLSGADKLSIHNTISQAIEARGKIGVIALTGLLWSALGFFQALVSAINKAWGNKPLNWWKLPLKNLLMLGILTAMLLLGVVAPTILDTIRAYVVLDKAIADALFGTISLLIPVGALFLGFLLFYKLAPRRRTQVTFSLVWIPALFVTVILQILQKLFVFYTTHITNLNAVYGTFGGVIALMLWTYLSGMVIIFGGCLCAAMRGAQTVS